MINIEKIEELNRLKRKLNDYKSSKRKKQITKKDAEQALERVNRRKREIENGLQKTTDTIVGRLNRITVPCRFSGVYLEKAKSQYLNSTTNSALTEFSDATRRITKDILHLEEEIDELNGKILSVEEQIRILSRQLEEKGE